MKGKTTASNNNFVNNNKCKIYTLSHCKIMNKKKWNKKYNKENIIYAKIPFKTNIHSSLYPFWGNRLHVCLASVC